MSFTQGDFGRISVGEEDDYVTRVDFVLPDKIDNLREEDYIFHHADKQIQARVLTMNCEEDDPLIGVGSGIHIGASGSGFDTIPFNAFTDNRGKYPARLLTLLIPYRIGSWPAGPDPLDFDKERYDYEEMKITGVQYNRDKIAILKIVNTLLKTQNESSLIMYDDVTVYLEVYYQKQSKEILVQRLNYLMSKDAYRNAIYDFVLPDLDDSGLIDSICAISVEEKTEEIETEVDLKRLVDTVIEKVLRHHIEDRRWIEPFWDDQREVEIKGQKHMFPKVPKTETSIQPTLHLIFHIALNHHGIHVVRESNEGIGYMDFGFLFTTKSGKPISVGAEFKLAHNKKIGHGIKKQLPSYLKAIESTNGTYIVMWFKDDELYTEPKSYNKKHITGWLIEQAKEVSEKNNMNISSALLDASIKPSASQI